MAGRASIRIQAGCIVPTVEIVGSSSAQIAGGNCGLATTFDASDGKTKCG